MEYDDFIRRLKAAGCKVDLVKLSRWPDGRTIEVYAVRRDGFTPRTLQVGPGDDDLPAMAAETIVRNMGLTWSEFVR